MVIVTDQSFCWPSTGVEKLTVRPEGGLAAKDGLCDEPNRMNVWLDSPGCTGLAEMVAATGDATTTTIPMAAMSGLARRSVFTGPN